MGIDKENGNRDTREIGKEKSCNVVTFHKFCRSKLLKLMSGKWQNALLKSLNDDQHPR